MSDSVDRVFVHALATVRRLPRTGSSRPPPASRLRLYGLYKQSMEGDVAAILPRPTLPVSSPDPNDPSVLQRYASRDLRTREAQAEIEKWDAWHACAGLTRTEAKRRYIGTLIDTMKEYASGTAESRELVGELEFVWNQIKSQSGSDPDDNASNESPSRRAAGGGIPGATTTQMMASFESSRPSVGSGDVSGLSARRGSLQDQEQKQQQQRRKPQRTQSGLRVLSPVSQRDADSIVEGVEEPQYEDDEEEEDDEDQHLDTAPSSPLAQQRHRQQHSPSHDRQMPLPSMGAHNINPPSDMTQSLVDWQRSLEGHLHALKTEIAALREQMSANHLLASSTYSHTYYTLSTRGRIVHRAKLYLRTFGTLFFRQLVVQLGILVLVLIWGRWKNDLRAEEWVKDVLVRIRKKMQSVFGGIGFWLLDLFGREGRLGFIGRILRIV